MKITKGELIGVGIGMIIMILLVVFTILFIPSDQTKNYYEGLGVGYERCSASLYPEVINSNLYIGYEEGIRIGYYEFNGTWYRNGIELIDSGEVGK